MKTRNKRKRREEVRRGEMEGNRNEHDGGGRLKKLLGTSCSPHLEDGTPQGRLLCRHGAPCGRAEAAPARVRARASASHRLPPRAGHPFLLGRTPVSAPRPPRGVDLSPHSCEPPRGAEIRAFISDFPPRLSARALPFAPRERSHPGSPVPGGPRAALPPRGDVRSGAMTPRAERPAAPALSAQKPGLRESGEKPGPPAPPMSGENGCEGPPLPAPSGPAPHVAPAPPAHLRAQPHPSALHGAGREGPKNLYGLFWSPALIGRPQVTTHSRAAGRGDIQGEERFRRTRG